MFGSAHPGRHSERSGLFPGVSVAPGKQVQGRLASWLLTPTSGMTVRDVTFHDEAPTPQTIAVIPRLTEFMLLESSVCITNVLCYLQTSTAFKPEAQIIVSKLLPI